MKRVIDLIDEENNDNNNNNNNKKQKENIDVLDLIKTTHMEHLTTVLNYKQSSFSIGHAPDNIRPLIYACVRQVFEDNLTMYALPFDKYKKVGTHHRGIGTVALSSAINRTCSIQGTNMKPETPSPEFAGLLQFVNLVVCKGDTHFNAVVIETYKPEDYLNADHLTKQNFSGHGGAIMIFVGMSRKMVLKHVTRQHADTVYEHYTDDCEIVNANGDFRKSITFEIPAVSNATPMMADSDAQYRWKRELARKIDHKLDAPYMVSFTFRSIL